MVDTVRTKAVLKTLFPDNTRHFNSSQSMRDLIETFFANGEARFNVRAYGAVDDSDGTSGSGTDNIDVLNHVCQLAKAAGGSVWIPPADPSNPASTGIFRFTCNGADGITALVIPSNVVVESSGRGGGAQLFADWTDDFADYQGRPGAAITNEAEGDYSNGLRNIRLVGDNPGGASGAVRIPSGLAFAGCIHPIVDNVLFYRLPGFGASIRASTQEYMCDNIADDCGAGGFEIATSDYAGAPAAGIAGNKFSVGAICSRNQTYSNGDDAYAFHGNFYAVAIGVNKRLTITDNIADFSMYPLFGELGYAQAGGASTITLQAGASAITQRWRGGVISTIAGTGTGQNRTISDYNSATKVATVSVPWVTPPDATTYYTITLASPGGRGIAISHATDVICTGNQIKDACGVGMLIDGVQNAIFDDNLINGMGHHPLPDRGEMIYFYDDVYESGTAQAGAAGSITLRAGASAADGYYYDASSSGLGRGTVAITAGTGSGQTRTITGYTGATKVLAVTPNWTVNPDNTSVYEVIYRHSNHVVFGTGNKFINGLTGNQIVIGSGILENAVIEGIWRDWHVGANFNATDFTADIGNWTLTSGDLVSFRYLLHGRTMTVSVHILESTLSGAPNDLQIKVPLGLAIVGYTVAAAFIRQSNVPGNYPGQVFATSSVPTTLLVALALGYTLFAASTNATNIDFEITFEVNNA